MVQVFQDFQYKKKKNGGDIDDKYFFSSEITLKKENEEVDKIGENAFKTIETNKKDYIYFENIKLNLESKKKKKMKKLKQIFQ